MKCSICIHWNRSQQVGPGKAGRLMENLEFPDTIDSYFLLVKNITIYQYLFWSVNRYNIHSKDTSCILVIVSYNCQCQPYSTKVIVITKVTPKQNDINVMITTRLLDFRSRAVSKINEMCSARPLQILEWTIDFLI